MLIGYKTIKSDLLILIVVLISTMRSSVLFANELKSATNGKKVDIPLDSISRIVTIIPPVQESSLVKFNIDECNRNGKFQRISGWVIVEKKQTKGQRIYVQLEKPDGVIVHYSTIPIERPDVGNFFKNPLYNASGFSAVLPLKAGLNSEACTIKFVVKNKHGVFKSKVWQTGISISSRTNVVPPEWETRAIKLNLEVNEGRKKGLFNYHYIRGWVYIRNQESKGQEVIIQLGKPDNTLVHYSTTPMERLDVGKFYKNAFYNASGFFASIPLEDGLDIDACAIRIVVKNKNGIFKSPAQKTGGSISSRIEIAQLEPESQAVNFIIDGYKTIKERTLNYHYLSGWIYINDQETRGQEIYVQLEKPNGTVVNYSTIQIERPDVGTGFKNPLYNASGFSASIPLKDGLVIDACTIRLVVKNKNGIYKSPEWKPWSKVSFSSGKPTIFVIVNWLLVIITCIALFVMIWMDRSLLLKPSIMAILFFHIMCQWGTALEAGRIEQFLPRPWVFVLLSHGFPVIGLAVSLLIWRLSVRAIWGQVIDQKPEDLSRKNKALMLLALFFVAFMLLYFSHVPFRTTGLYKIFFSPAESGLARDMSVKFLGNAFLRYGHNIMMAVFAPLMAVLTMQILLIHWQKRNWSWMAFYLTCLVVIFLAASISGARSYSAGIIMVILFALLLRRGFLLRPAYLVVIALLILTFPTLLSLLREGKAVTATNFFAYLRGSTFERVVITPMKTGLYHVQYAQQHGYFGIKAIPKLATTMGIEPLNVPDFIAKYMSGSPLDTSTANTAYIYAYYSYFGLIAFLPCLLGLWLLDLSLLVYRCLSNTMLIPCVAGVAIGVNIFSSVEYTVGLFTFGILLLPLVSWSVDRTVIMSESVALKKKR
jgi:hypothetical protein